MTAQRLSQWFALLLPAGLLGGALISEHLFGLYPCEMCIWQRWPHLAALVLALPALFMGERPAGRILTVLAAIAVMVSGLIGGFHAGVEYGWWEGVTACATDISADSDMLDTIMNAPIVRCDVAPWTLFGISLAGYNFLLSVGGAALILVMLLRNGKGANG